MEALQGVEHALTSAYVSRSHTLTTLTTGLRMGEE